MGLLKKLKKGLKRIFKGVKKVFKKVVKAFGKIAGSKFGKILMLAAAVFTGGVALGAWSAWGGFSTAAGGFAGKFIAGVNKVMSFMTGGAAGAGKGATMAGQTLTQGGASAAGEALTPSAAAVGEGVAAGELVGAAVPEGVGLLAEEGIAAALPGVATTGGEVLGTTAAKSLAGTALTPARESLMTRATSWAKSTGGQNIIGSMLEGYERGKELDDVLDFRREESRRVEDLWANFDSSNIDFRAAERNLPEGLIGRNRRVNQPGTPTYQPKDPVTVAGYATP